jgi:hypothetical protein
MAVKIAAVERGVSGQLTGVPHDQIEELAFDTR